MPGQLEQHDLPLAEPVSCGPLVGREKKPIYITPNTVCHFNKGDIRTGTITTTNSDKYNSL